MILDSQTSCREIRDNLQAPGTQRAKEREIEGVGCRGQVSGLRIRGEARPEG